MVTRRTIDLLQMKSLTIISDSRGDRGMSVPVGPVGIFVERIAPGVSQSIKIGIDLSIDISIKIGKSDLIDIDCIDQSVEVDDTLVSFIDLS